KSAWKRFTIYAAGPLANILLAFVLLSAFFALPVAVIVGDGVMLYSVAEGSPADTAGLEPGNVILEVEGERIRKWADIQQIISSSRGGEEIALVVQEDEGQRELSLIPEFNPDLGRLAIGVTLCRNLVKQIEQGSAADEAGISPGDSILSVNEQGVYSLESMCSALDSIEDGERVRLVLLRRGAITESSIPKEPISGRQVMGMELRWVDGAHVGQERLAIWKALYLGGSYIIRVPELIAASVPLMKEDPSRALVGPIGAGQLTVEAVKSFGFSNVLFMAGLISLGIGLFNFLPVPPLDGAGMLVALVEGIRRGKRLSRRALRSAYTIGTALLVTLMVLITYNDILRIVTGGSFGL
ncbi:site-2 protease family protein, partial [Candidatus Bipolaricaulota bacterium]|nr:site-2 protease family protein [Candidatus Bipolaricaulota bacterium]